MRMLAEGNSEVGPCAACLLSALQREVPFARSKGIDPDVMDMPLNETAGYLDETARDVISAYEPRVNVGTADFDFDEADDPSEAPYRVSLVEGSEEDGDAE